MDKHQDRMNDRLTMVDEASFANESDVADEWVHEVIAMTRPGVEIQFPARAIDEREIPFVTDDFR